MTSSPIARRASILALAVLLSVAPGPDARADDDATLWDSVKTQTIQVFAAGTGVLRSAYAWITSFGGGSSRLADDLVAFSGKDLRDLEVLVDSAGYKLEDITIHLGTPSPDVTFSFGYQQTIPAKRKAELRDIIASDNALVDDDTRTIVKALLDASLRAQMVSADKFRFHHVHIRIGQTPQVVFDFSTQKSASSQSNPTWRRELTSYAGSGLPSAIPAVVSSAEAATPLVMVLNDDSETYRFADAAPPPAPARPAPVAQPEPAKPPYDPVGLAEPTRAPAAVSPPPVPEAAKAETPKLAEPAPVPEPAKVEVIKAAEPAPNPEPVKVEVTKAAEPAPNPEPVKVEVTKAAEPTPNPEPVKVEVTKAAEPTPNPEPANVEVIKAAEPAPNPEPVKVEVTKAAEPAPAPEPVKVEVIKAAEPAPAPEPVKVEVIKAAEPAPNPEPAKVDATKVAEPAKLATPTFRVVRASVNARVGPNRDSDVVRTLSPALPLVKTGKSQGRWFEMTVVGETERFWVYETMLEAR